MPIPNFYINMLLSISKMIPLAVTKIYNDILKPSWKGLDPNQVPESKTVKNSFNALDKESDTIAL